MTTRWERAASAKFPCKKQQAIAALLTQPTVAEAARVTDIRPQTLYRWMKDPEFIAVYRKARRATYRQAIARLQQASAAVVTVLLKVMYNPGAPASARLKAADSVLRHAKAAGEMEEILGQAVEGREKVADFFAGIVKPFDQGGLCGAKFAREHTFAVGETVGVQWVATADFLAEPYRGSDAYITRKGLMAATVTTFQGAQLKPKKTPKAK